jgi:5-methylcytosine-specific restriction enzyme subunit McrC
VRLTAQASRESLCIHKGEPIFRLQPDILIEQGTDRWVLDTKWKRLDAGAESNKYGLSQADFYQLFAYGRKYLEGQGKVALIFPMTGSFSAPLSPFSFDENLTLQVLPFDLERACLVTPEDTDLPIASAHAVVQEPDPSRPQSLIDSVFQISCARAIRRLV